MNAEGTRAGWGRGKEYICTRSLVRLEFGAAGKREKTFLVSLGGMGLEAGCEGDWDWLGSEIGCWAEMGLKMEPLEIVPSLHH